MNQKDTIKTRLLRISEEIAAASEAAGRASTAVQLVGVSKTFPVSALLVAYEAGLRHFGESRPEELARKRQAMRAELGPDSGIVWHQIGTIQSRKVKLVAEHADVVHAVDRLKIAARLSQQLVEKGRSLTVLLEVNVSGEASKQGFPADHWATNEGVQQALSTVTEQINSLPGLQLTGLMSMAPWGVPEAEIEAVFAATRQLRDWLQTAVARPLPQLSMGMSGDFPIAIREGATYVRVGRALFGARDEY